MTFEQAVDSFGWGELVNFSRHLPEDSATFRAKYGDSYVFSSRLQQSMMLADAIDGISLLVYTVAKAYGGKGKKPSKYPRPWDVDNAEHIGSDPIPISEFNEWYYGGD